MEVDDGASAVVALWSFVGRRGCARAQPCRLCCAHGIAGGAHGKPSGRRSCRLLVSKGRSSFFEHTFSQERVRASATPLSSHARHSGWVQWTGRSSGRHTGTSLQKSWAKWGCCSSLVRCWLSHDSQCSLAPMVTGFLHILSLTDLSAICWQRVALCAKMFRQDRTGRCRFLWAVGELQGRECPCVSADAAVGMWSREVRRSMRMDASRRHGPTFRTQRSLWMP